MLRAYLVIARHKGLPVAELIVQHQLDRI
jgi:hypothetical protein